MQTKENKEPQPSPERETLSPALREQFDRMDDYAYKATMLSQLTADPALKNALRNFTAMFIGARKGLLLAYAEGRQAGAQEERERRERIGEQRFQEEYARLRATRCTVPPPGWWCSRTPGHDGPCAARPTSQDPQEPQR